MGRTLLFLILLVVFSHPPAVAKTYQDPKGRFVADLPKGWSLKSISNDIIYTFEGGGDAQVNIVYFPPAARMDRETLFSAALEQCESEGLTNPAPEGKNYIMTINGNPAKWGAYGGYVTGETIVSLTVLVGSVELKSGGLYFRSYVNKFNRKKMGQKLEAMFSSIRDPGSEPAGVAERQSIAIPAAGKDAGTTPFDHKLVTMTLPQGWKPKKLGANFEKEVIGWFMSGDIPGASVLAVCYRGLGMTLAKAEVAARRTAEATLPNSIPGPTGLIMTRAGSAASIMIYTGSSVSEGKRMEMKIVTATLKTKKCKLFLMGTTQSRFWDDAQHEMIQIIKSAK